MRRVHGSSLRPTHDAARKYKTEGARATREVEPHYLLCSWPGWDLVVWDHLRAGVRALRLDRIESAQTLDTPFRLHAVEDCS